MLFTILLVASPLCESIHRIQVHAAGLHALLTCPTRLFRFPEKRMSFLREKHPHPQCGKPNHLQNSPSQGEITTKVLRNSTQRDKRAAILRKFQSFKYRQTTNRHTLYRRLVHAFDAPLLTVDVKQSGNAPSGSKPTVLVFLHAYIVFISVGLRSEGIVKLCARCIIKQARNICQYTKRNSRLVQGSERTVETI